MPRRVVGILLLLLVLATPLLAQGEALFHTGVDTLPAFRLQLMALRGRLLKPYVVDEAQEEAELRCLYERSQQRMQSNDWIRVAHISRYLPQQVNHRTEMAAQELMDSLYVRLKAGEDFAVLAARYSDDAGSREQGGLLPWMAMNKNLQEWVDRLARLGKDEISEPFYSPLGLHIVKWVDRKPAVSFEERKAELQAYRERKGLVKLRDILADKQEEIASLSADLRSGLLADCLMRQYQQQEQAYSESDLEAYFKAHKADYRWELPHYRGAVVYGRDKKTVATIRKYLKKFPLEQWDRVFRQIIAKDSVPRARLEAGVFQIGQNPAIDKLVFKCGPFRPDEALPCVVVIGKKLKKGPESYRDVRAEVVRDYEKVRREAWMEELKRIYKIEINEEVLKMVKTIGSN